MGPRRLNPAALDIRERLWPYIGGIATYSDPETDENIRQAEEADEHWRKYHFGWYGHP
jgi:hypothetical protein